MHMLLLILKRQSEGRAWLLGRDYSNPFLLKPSSHHPRRLFQTSTATASVTSFPRSRSSLKFAAKPHQHTEYNQLKILKKMTANKRLGHFSIQLVQAAVTFISQRSSCFCRTKGVRSSCTKVLPHHSQKGKLLAQLCAHAKGDTF